MFRTAFDFGGREVAHWFPGHMAKGDGSFPDVAAVFDQRRSEQPCIQSEVPVVIVILPWYFCRTETNESQPQECGLYCRNP